MTIYIGADHRGFQLKQELLSWLNDQNESVIDCGNIKLDPTDNYPDFAFAVADHVVQAETSRGIILCGSGVGATVAANKVAGARCCLGFSVAQVTAGRHDDNMNILTIATNFTSLELAQQLISAFLDTPFGEAERYQYRLDQISQREKKDAHI